MNAYNYYADQARDAYILRMQLNSKPKMTDFESRVLLQKFEQLWGAENALIALLLINLDQVKAVRAYMEEKYPIAT